MNKLKTGGTYRHYKTKGLYKALQLVKFEDRTTQIFDQHVAEVTYTGDGPFENTYTQLYLAFTPTVRLYLVYGSALASSLEPRRETPREQIQVLYWSDEHRRYFARPHAEFSAMVEVPRHPPGDHLLSVSVPRFELIE